MRRSFVPVVFASAVFLAPSTPQRACAVWPQFGRALATAPGDQASPAIAPDGQGGAIVTWVADGARGAIVAWRDARSGSAHNMFAQHLLGSGSVDTAWPVNGTALSLATTEQTRPSIASDGGGGALVTWQENLDIFTQHVLASGVLDSAFAVRGLPPCNLTSKQENPAMTGAGTKTIVTWSDLRSGIDFDIFAMQVLAAVTVDVEDTASLLVKFAPPHPSPTRGPVALRFALPREALVDLTIYDPSGHQVRRFATGARTAGEHVVEWDLRDDAGHNVMAGIYFARLEATGHVLVRKIVALR